MKLPHLSREPHDFASSVFDCLADAAPTEAGHAGHWVDLGALRLGPGYSYDYALGLLRLPLAFGMVELHLPTRAARVTSVNAGYLLRQFSDLLACDAPLVTDWEHEEVSRPEDGEQLFSRGANLLAAVEQRRLELLPQAAPVRSLEAAYGLVTEQRDGEAHYLLNYDGAARAWQMLGGRFEAGDRSLRATLLRELAEELKIAPLHEPDQLTLEPLLQRVAGTRLSPSRGLLSRTVFHFFLVSWRGPVPLVHSGVRWFSERELRAGRSDDGQLISAEPVITLLDKRANEPALLALAPQASHEAALALG